jgi:hypothetical protein
MDILNRIQAKQQEFQKKIEKKKQAEREWFDKKYQPVNGNNSNETNK